MPGLGLLDRELGLVAFAGSWQTPTPPLRPPPCGCSAARVRLGYAGLRFPGVVLGGRAGRKAEADGGAALCCPTHTIGLKETVKDLETVGDMGTAQNQLPPLRGSQGEGRSETLPGAEGEGEADGRRSWCPARSGWGGWSGFWGVSGAGDRPLRLDTLSASRSPHAPCRHFPLRLPGSREHRGPGSGTGPRPPAAQLGAWRGPVSPPSAAERSL